MKMRRFTPAGIIAVKAFLADIKALGQLDLVRRDQLLTGPLTEPISALADLDLDTARVFDTTFAFCEYFDSLIHDYNPQAYRADVGFWTWLAMAYLPQLVLDVRGRFRIGEEARLVYSFNYTEMHRHLLASPFYIFELYRSNSKVCKCVMWNRLSVHGELQEQIAARQPIVQNPALMGVVSALYFDFTKNNVKKGSGGSGPGSPRRFAEAVDQFAMTRDFFSDDDVVEFLKILPEEFDRFNPAREGENVE